MIWQRTNGIRPAVAAPAPDAAPAAEDHGRSIEDQREYEEFTARCDKRGGPFEPGLEAAERRLAFMKNLYDHGGFMGHPEDLLEDIDIEKRHIARLRAEAASA